MEKNKTQNSEQLLNFFGTPNPQQIQKSKTLTNSQNFVDKKSQSQFNRTQTQKQEQAQLSFSQNQEKNNQNPQIQKQFQDETNFNIQEDINQNLEASNLTKSRMKILTYSKEEIQKYLQLQSFINNFKQLPIIKDEQNTFLQNIKAPNLSNKCLNVKFLSNSYQNGKGVIYYKSNQNSKISEIFQPIYGKSKVNNQYRRRLQNLIAEKIDNFEENDKQEKQLQELTQIENLNIENYIKVYEKLNNMLKNPQMPKIQIQKVQTTLNNINELKQKMIQSKGNEDQKYQVAFFNKQIQTIIEDTKPQQIDHGQLDLTIKTLNHKIIEYQNQINDIMIAKQNISKQTNPLQKQQLIKDFNNRLLEIYKVLQKIEI